MKWLLAYILAFCFTDCISQKPGCTVAKDGSGDFNTIQQAIDNVPANNKTDYIIMIMPGVYHERVVVPAGKDHIRFVGMGRAQTILTFDNHTGALSPNGDTINTYTSASLFIYANDFHAEDITFENNAGFNAGQAVAVFAQGDRLAFFVCHFIGFQDVLFLSGEKSRQYYKNCYIEGTTDFIFGPATAVFDRCVIHSKKNSHVTAASTPAESAFGFVFLDCELTADTSLHNVSLGRPWRPYASVTYIRCKLGPHIIPEGWNNWKNPANEKTARYAEYKSTGPGANPHARVPWSRQLTKKELKAYTLENIFGDWIPPYTELKKFGPGRVLLSTKSRTRPTTAKE
jgi:pectinesterase